MEQTFNDPSVNIRLKTGEDRLNDKRIVVPIQRTALIDKYCCVFTSSNETIVIPEKETRKDVLPYYFGIAASTRDDLIKNHTTEIAKTLFEAHEHLFLICDGTHARHQKMMPAH